MPRMAIARDFLDAFGKLDNSVQRRVKDALTKFEHLSHAGGHLEKLSGSRDPRVRTVRIDDNFRGILLSPDKGDLFVLVTVLPHRQADLWVTRNTFRANEASGALEVIDVIALDDFQAQHVSTAGIPSSKLFERVSDNDLKRLGVGEDVLPLVRLVSDIDSLLSLATLLPKHVAGTLMMLFEGQSVEDVWHEVAASFQPLSAEADLTEAVMSPASADQFRVVEGPDELARILDQPFDLWRIFLHDSQHKIAYRTSYNGSVRVTGGAGTGKTVVAMHRAKALLERDDFEGRILFTTFTRNLVTAIERSLRKLLTKDQMDRVDVRNVDQLAVAIVREHEGAMPGILDDQAELVVWGAAADTAGVDLAADFLRQEWRQVILGNGISRRDDYLAVARAGRGGRLTRRERIDIWRVVEEFVKHTERPGRRTYLQLADEATRYLRSRVVRPYGAVIVDEAQDLHPAAWRMLRQLVLKGPDDLFIVGDAHQRIYDNKVSLRKVDIDVVGRSRRLTINYRTTHEILRWSSEMLDSVTVDDLDDGQDTLSGYRSLLHGNRPAVVGFADASAEARHIVGWIRERLAGGVAAGDICLVTRTHADVEWLLKALSAARLPAAEVTAKAQPDELTVHCATMHRVKGLEYQVIAIANASAGSLPISSVEQLRGTDSVEYERELQRERSLLFVATTRARDEVLVTHRGKPSPFLP